MKRGRALRRRYGHAAEGFLSVDEVERLPVGSIVWNGITLVVLSGGNLTQTALLPKQAGSTAAIWGEPAKMWGHEEYALVARGQGKLPTHGTAQRKAMTWWESPSGIEARRRLQGDSWMGKT